jgi:hypothetical protein
VTIRIGRVKSSIIIAITPLRTASTIMTVTRTRIRMNSGRLTPMADYP